jgi:ferritin
MIPKKLKTALDDHISAEMSAAYLYLAMSADFDTKAYKGFGRWMRVQFQEEMEHALKFVDYVLLRGESIAWKDAKAPVSTFGTPLEAFEKTLAHEKDVTARIHELYHLAVAEKDLATQVFLQWFVTEQTEEEARVGEIVEKVRLTSDRPGSLLYLDKEFGKRTA